MKLTCDTKEHTRKAYGETLVELGGEDPNIVVVDADLSSSTQTIMFAREYPDRFFNVGCAEQNLMGLSAGLALAGKTVFTSAFAMFGAGRGWEQIRNTIAYDSLNVKIVLTHAGITVGKDGSSHQIIEDLSLMRVIPGMKVQVPADPVETRAMVRAAARYEGPIYMRLTREKSPVLFEDYGKFTDKPRKLLEGSDVSIFACGYMVSEAIQAAAELKKKGISASLLNMHTIKPLDREFVAKAAKETGAVVSVEEHSIHGGLGSALAEALAEDCPTPMRRVGIRDRFGKSGSAEDLLQMYNLKSADIVKAAEEAVKMKK
ncbi:MAG: transketolase family protein [Candidatus Altiarchaeales archaeon]|nr:transketolase family protein [Candidatus Altiarchaeales archaeon]MBD3416615.1 transketolase family protein [Candidatus Altiarchaeales archaeon]